MAEGAGAARVPARHRRTAAVRDRGRAGVLGSGDGPLLPAQARCLVVEDSLHEYDTTLAALRGFHRFVPAAGFFVVEDGCVDIEERRLVDDWPRGVLPALNDWMRTPEAEPFRVRRDLELYGISCHPSGFLERVPADA